MEGGGESSNSRQRRERQRHSRQRRASERISYESSVANLSREGRRTLNLVNGGRTERRQINAIPDTVCAVFDNTCSYYEWLCSGWIVEERLKPNNRLYRYYYGPLGQRFDTRYDVELLCAGNQKNRVTITLD